MVKNVYLIGIGGIGMSGLARYFHKRGCFVCGYDKTATALTAALIEDGMEISFTDDATTVPENFYQQKEDNLIIYTPAIPADSEIFNAFKKRGIPLYKRSQVLGKLSEGMFTIAVAGTHGKTTTSTIIAHILTHSGYGCSAFLGGIATNYNSNVLFSNNNVLVAEADEYDRSFLTLHPDISVITSTDADHLDIYGDDQQLKKSFNLFAAQLKPDGKLLKKYGLDIKGGKTYGHNNTADCRYSNITIKEGAFYFDYHDENHQLTDIKINLPGKHNVENATAAIYVAFTLGLGADDIKNALASFLGVKRRFEFIHRSADKVYIDDYAHHPEELKACFDAARTLYPDRKLTVIFQPHLFTRTRDFAAGFLEVLNTVDELILLDIYPAREKPIEGINSDMLLKQITAPFKQKCGKEEVLHLWKNGLPELLLTVGAGDIDTLVQPLKNLYSNA